MRKIEVSAIAWSGDAFSSEIRYPYLQRIEVAIWIWISRDDTLPSLFANLKNRLLQWRAERKNKRWGKESEEWPNIKHIPYILIDLEYIQKDGRYVKGEGLSY